MDHLDTGMVVYNFAAGSFHTKKLCSRLYSTEVDFYTKNEKSLFEPPFLDLGVTYALHSSLESAWSTLYSSRLNCDG